MQNNIQLSANFVKYYACVCVWVFVFGCVCWVCVCVFGCAERKSMTHQYLTVVDTESVLVLFIFMISHIPEVSIMDLYKRVQNKWFASNFFLSNHRK